jgi:hypothetical protein
MEKRKLLYHGRSVYDLKKEQLIEAVFVLYDMLQEQKDSQARIIDLMMHPKASD